MMISGKILSAQVSYRDWAAYGNVIVGNVGLASR
jgi:hypothetical protein